MSRPAGRTSKDSICCPLCELQVPGPNTNADFKITTPDGCQNEKHKRIFCFRCNNTFHACFRCNRIRNHIQYSLFKTNCKCEKLVTRGAQSVETENNNGDHKGRSDACARDEDKDEESTESKRVPNHQSSTQCQEEAATVEDSAADDFDGCIFGDGNGGGFEGDADDLPADCGTEIPAETEWNKVYNLLSNNNEYPENTARYLLAEHEEPGRGRRVVVQHALGDDPAKETRGRQQQRFPLPPTLIYDSVPSQEEADLHFLIAATHYSGTEKSSSAHTTILREFAKHSSEKRDSMIKAMDSSIKERLQNITQLAHQIGGDNAQHLIAQLTIGFAQGVREDVKKAELDADTAKFNFPTSDSEITRQYTRGNFSIMNSLPCPSITCDCPRLWS